MPKPKIYFGHPINVYNTDLEKMLLVIIAKLLSEYDIENPNQKKHTDGYQRYKEQTGRGMNYYFEEVLPSCDAGIFLPFRDGAWGKGVFGEAKFLEKNKKLIWQIDHLGLISDVRLADIWVLSVPETIKRIRTETGAVVPY